MWRKTLWAASPLLIVLGSCAHTRPEPAGPACNYRAVPLGVGENHAGGPAPPGAALPAPDQTFADEILEVLRTPSPPRQPPPLGPPSPGPPSLDPFEGHAQDDAAHVAVLSGGSQHGAFGAGFFLGVGEHAPRYKLVTGVSTGALQSTLVFLAADPLPAGGRDYPADLGEGKIATGVSNAGDLAAAFSISDEPTLLRVASSQLYGGLVQGAVGSLEPLRRRLSGFVSDGTLQALKQANDVERRKLYVGVTDLDDGRGYALDLTELAARLGDDSRPGPHDAAALRRCYVDALIASSSVPLAAYPVTLDIVPRGETTARRHLFIDGGARFGVFLSQVADEIEARRKRTADTTPLPKTHVTMIVNGRLYGRAWGEEKWSSISVVKRAVDLLTNQVYRFSIDDAERFPRNGGTLRMAFISNENLTAMPADPADHPYEYREKDGSTSTKTCAQWTGVDKARTRPIEFHARYMACLLDYGRTRATTDPWNLVRRDPPDARDIPAP